MSTTATYLIVEAKRDYGARDPETGLRPVSSVRVVGSRAGRPAKLERDQIAVKIQLAIPASSFNPVTPTAVVTVPESLALRGPIEVDADDANEEN
ncbi:hypothetical protein BRM3_09030 [Brachybacterium huguangmaarense]|uniref:Uncharacterized protein n=1 Tax=Brachybacterium huguangmaarense TaxID=1652028 RepID=A0ABY6FXZ0_9MICO|nr:hypothetical protein [Brachybacterium huguangmaarense]UYG15788.1 hypothetical protein BRM3_09030 [Brachybacterium huguangmaarense]